MWKHVNSIQFTDDVLPYVRMSLDCVADILAVDWLFKHQNHWVPAQVLSLVESSKQQRSTIGYSEDLRSRMIKAKNHQRSLRTVRFFFLQFQSNLHEWGRCFFKPISMANDMIWHDHDEISSKARVDSAVCPGQEMTSAVTSSDQSEPPHLSDFSSPKKSHAH